MNRLARLTVKIIHCKVTFQFNIDDHGDTIVSDNFEETFGKEAIAEFTDTLVQLSEFVTIPPELILEYGGISIAQQYLYSDSEKARESDIFTLFDEGALDLIKKMLAVFETGNQKFYYVVKR